MENDYRVTEKMAGADDAACVVSLDKSSIKLLIPKDYEKVTLEESVQAELEKQMKCCVVYGMAVPTSENIVMIFKITPDKAMDFADVQGLVDGIHNSLADNQGLIEVNAGKTRRGYDYIYSIVKTLKDNMAGVEYYLRMNIRNGNEILEINADFDEQGMTGIRESTAMNLAMNAGLISHGEDGKLAGWSEDPYDATYTAQNQ